MKGSLLATRPTLGGILLGICLGVTAVALGVVAFALDSSPSTTNQVLVFAGVIALASTSLIVLPTDWADRPRRATAPVDATPAAPQLRLVPAVPDRRPFDWAVDGW